MTPVEAIDRELNRLHEELDDCLSNDLRNPLIEVIRNLSGDLVTLADEASLAERKAKRLELFLKQVLNDDFDRFELKTLAHCHALELGINVKGEEEDVPDN